MKLIIDIPKEKYEMFLNGGYAGLLDKDLYYDIMNGTPILDNATNGDALMAMFPTINTYFSNIIDMKLWWKAKYKGTGEIHCTCTDEERLLQCVFCQRDALTCGCDETDEDANGLCKKYQGAVIFEPQESEDKEQEPTDWHGKYSDDEQAYTAFAKEYINRSKAESEG